MPALLLLLLSLLLLQALNEFDLRATDWRKKLESQRGAVLAFETKVGVARHMSRHMSCFTPCTCHVSLPAGGRDCPLVT
jgi:hypothetical protein